MPVIRQAKPIHLKIFFLEIPWRSDISFERANQPWIQREDGRLRRRVRKPRFGLMDVPFNPGQTAIFDAVHVELQLDGACLTDSRWPLE